ncbi:MAG: phosphoribosylaminoimidazolesuccinocarboxamide synthase [Verrucomicrobia bacterium]|nr:phosphoribosylaminoimidazolesuccinocarboxamide synthase [Verrucomicrobiota bacterium]
MSAGIMTIEMPGITRFKSGKVREVFDLGDTLLFVATDRLSAFDCILPDPIPDKGKVLTQISLFWFDFLAGICENHVVTGDLDEYPEELAPYRKQLAGRSMIGIKADVVPIECVVRGYLAGSGWKEYRQSQSVCGIALPDGLKLGSELPEPIFTPATKAETGHDENITQERAAELVGEATAGELASMSLAIYTRARDYARERGIILCDTKFEFGERDGELILIDEVLTPDSSRFWPADQWEPGHIQPSFDKQYVRDYLETLDWDKTPPAPRLPRKVIDGTRARYVEAYERLTGKAFEG